MSLNILVTGATGNQGGAVIKALCSLEDGAIHVQAVSRNTSSSRAQDLLQRYQHLTPVEGSCDEPETIFSSCGVPITAVFAVQMLVGFPPDADAEEKHGKGLIDAAVTHGVNTLGAFESKNVTSRSPPARAPSWQC